MDCQGIVVFSFHNILTQHLVHKNSIRLIAYYLFITQIHEKVFDENLVLTLKATFLNFIHSFSQVNGNLISTFDEKVRLGHFQIQTLNILNRYLLLTLHFHKTKVQIQTKFNQNSNKISYKNVSYKNSVCGIKGEK